MTYKVDVALLASLARNQRGTRTLRKAADEISRTQGPISAASLLRVEDQKQPDLAMFLHLCNWLQVSPARLLYSTSVPPPAPTPAGDTAATVVRLLRSDKRLAPAMANVLAIMVEATYAQLATNE